MRYKFSLVPYGMISSVIPQVLHYLEVSKKWTRGRAEIDDILRFVLTGQMQLWVVLDGDRISGQVITEIKQYPRCNMLTVQYCAADPQCMQFVDDEAFGTLENFARDSGCAGVEMIGRPGWKKEAFKRGYTTQSVMYQKFFERGQDEPT